VIPTRRCFLLVLAATPLALLPSLGYASIWYLWPASIGAILFVLALDWLASVPGARIDAVLAGVQEVPLKGVRSLRVTVKVPPGTKPLRMRMRIEGDERVAVETDHEFVISGETPTELSIPVRGLLRGPAAVVGPWLRWSGPWGLVERRRTRIEEHRLTVVPDLAAVRGLAVRFLQHRNHESGLRVERYAGDGTEFEALREYVPGLDTRSLDWRASARHRRLICREFRAERNHSIIVAVDTGRLMRGVVDGVPKLDHAVTAGLALSWLGLQTGDRVGLFAFDAQVRAWFPPRGGREAFPHIRRATAELEYQTVETNFTLGLTELSRRLRRRSLVVLMTDFVDTVTAELMLDNVARLARRHLVLFVAIRNQALVDVAHAEPHSVDTLYESIVAGDLLRERERVLSRLEHLGALCIDVPPERITGRILNRYLDIKRREQI
jgi:uncharacterized protein (DUF58 family)